MIRDTSLDAFRDPDQGPTRRTQLKQIHQILTDRGKMSAGQLSKETGLPPGRVHARLNRLVDLGMVTDAGKAPIGSGGLMVHLWDVTA